MHNLPDEVHHSDPDAIAEVIIKALPMLRIPTNLSVHAASHDLFEDRVPADGEETDDTAEVDRIAEAYPEYSLRARHLVGMVQRDWDGK